MILDMIQNNGISGTSKKDNLMVYKKKITVLGGSGMLGSMVVDLLHRNQNFSINATVRNSQILKKCKSRLPEINWKVLDVSLINEKKLVELICNSHWVINAIGVIKPYINDNISKEVERAIFINSVFPHILNRVAEKNSVRVLQIATDCVYNGEKGSYKEYDPHNSLDVYGKTKSLGECYSDNVINIRCSIIGPELKGNLSLLEWFLGQQKGAELNGFNDHEWNGVTTLHFAKICESIILNDLSISTLQHIIPNDKVNKYELLLMFQKYYEREDLIINSIKSKNIIDRTLSTEKKDVNSKIWLFAGYKNPPTIESMVKQLARQNYWFK